MDCQLGVRTNVLRLLPRHRDVPAAVLRRAASKNHTFCTQQARVVTGSPIPSFYQGVAKCEAAVVGGEAAIRPSTYLASSHSIEGEQ